MPDSKTDRDFEPVPGHRTELEKIHLLEDRATIRQRFANLPRFDSRSADESLGYDEHGLPS